MTAANVLLISLLFGDGLWGKKARIRNTEEKDDNKGEEGMRKFGVK